MTLEKRNGLVYLAVCMCRMCSALNLYDNMCCSVQSLHVYQGPADPGVFFKGGGGGGGQG